MPEPTFLSGGSTPRRSDTINTLLKRIAGGIANNGSGGGGETGSGSPEGVVTANPGVTYWDSMNEVFWVKNSGTGNTGWYQLVGG